MPIFPIRPHIFSLKKPRIGTGGRGKIRGQGVHAAPGFRSSTCEAFVAWHPLAIREGVPIHSSWAFLWCSY